jgi:recombination DNA repair RAD52 pathway protein
MSKELIYTKAELQKAAEPALSSEQMSFLLKPTPAQFRKTRPAKGGGTWEYVSGAYVKKVLNLMFGFAWSFEVKEFQVDHNAKQCLVLGRLTCRGANGIQIIKEQFGRVDIKYRKDSTQPLDIGNDLKAATTDALKKCAAEVGVAMDVYSGEEMNHITVVDTQEEKTSLEHDRAAAWVKANGITDINEVPEKYRTSEAVINAIKANGNV